MRNHWIICFYGLLLFSFGNSYAASSEWATDKGSCYQQGDLTLHGGLSFFHFGLYGAGSYAFHEAIEGGGALGYNGFEYSSYWRYNYFPIVVRVAFHPFNLKVLSSKIKVRDQLDVYVGLATGWRVAWATEKRDVTGLPKPDLKPFVFREWFGVRFYINDKIFLVAEEGGGLSILNLGVGIKLLSK